MALHGVDAINSFFDQPIRMKPSFTWEKYEAREGEREQNRETKHESEPSTADNPQGTLFTVVLASPQLGDPIQVGCGYILYRDRSCLSSSLMIALFLSECWGRGPSSPPNKTCMIEKYQASVGIQLVLWRKNIAQVSYFTILYLHGDLFTRDDAVVLYLHGGLFTRDDAVGSLWDDTLCGRKRGPATTMV